MTATEEQNSSVSAEDLVKDLDRILDRNNESAGVLIILGSLYLNAGKFKEAESISLKAVKTEPQNPAAHYNLGGIYSVACYNMKNPSLSLEMHWEGINANGLGQLTPGKLGYGYKKVRELAQLHTTNTIILSDEDNPLNKAAKEQLVTLKMTDHM